MENMVARQSSHHLLVLDSAYADSALIIPAQSLHIRVPRQQLNLLFIQSHFLFLGLITNRLVRRVYTVAIRLVPFEVDEAITGKRHKVIEELVHILELFPMLIIDLLHHFELLIDSLRDEVQGTMRVVYRNLFIV